MAKPDNPFRHFNSSPEVIRLVVVMYVKFPLSLCNVEGLLAERGIDTSRRITFAGRRPFPRVLRAAPRHLTLGMMARNRPSNSHSQPVR
jgi:transposase-like protein